MNYDWIQNGAKVRIKTVEEIKKIYPRGMPYGLLPDMYQYCGTTQTISGFHLGALDNQNAKFDITIQNWSWPETVLSPLTSKLGNEI